MKTASAFLAVLLLAGFAGSQQVTLQSPVLAPPLPEVVVPFEQPVQAQSRLAQDSSFTIKKALLNLGTYQEVGGMLLVDEQAMPTLAYVGYLKLNGDFDTSVVEADDIDRNIVPVEKVNDNEWLVKGVGRVFIRATLATKEPFGITVQRFDVVIPGVELPDDGDDDKPDDPIDPLPGPVPTDRFDNLGQRVAAIAPTQKRKEVAAVYREYAQALRTSFETASIAQKMVAARDQVLGNVKTAWADVLSLIAKDFSNRRPDMVREDVVDHWLAIANGLDPQ